MHIARVIVGSILLFNLFLILFKLARWRRHDVGFPVPRSEWPMTLPTVVFWG